MATLFPMQRRHSWPSLPRGRTAASSSTCQQGDPAPFRQSCFITGLLEPVCGAWRYFFQGRIPSMSFLSAYFSSLLRSHCMTAQLLPDFLSSENSAGMHSLPLSTQLSWDPTWRTVFRYGVRSKRKTQTCYKGNSFELKKTKPKQKKIDLD